MCTLRGRKPLVASGCYYRMMMEEAGPKGLIKVLTYDTSKASRYVISEMGPGYRCKVAFVANPITHHSGNLTSYDATANGLIGS
jgi:hypothetical protein